MKSKELIDLLSGILKKAGYKKKGNTWLFKNDEITKIINLQKSGFSNTYYLNYGYIINSIPLAGLKMHFYSRLGSRDLNENEQIKRILDLDNDLGDTERSTALRRLLQDNLLEKIEEVNTEENVKNEFLKNEKNMLIPIAVKRHFNLLKS